MDRLEANICGGCHGRHRSRTSRRTTPTSTACPTRPSATCASTTPCTGPRSPTADAASGASRSTTTCSSPVAPPRSSRADSGIRLEDMDPEETEARRTLMEMDAPEHTRLRRLVSRPFAPKSVNEYEDAVREHRGPGPRLARGRARVRLRPTRGARAADAHARPAPGPARRGPRVAGPAWRRADRQHRSRLHRLRRRPGRHLRLPTAALSLARSPSSSSSTPLRRSTSGASARPTTS